MSPQNPKDDLVQRLVRTVRSEVERAGLAGEGLVVAVSGGPDSMALLALLAELREPCGLRLHVAHLNHGLRLEADGDERFVAEHALRLGLPFTSRRADIVAYRRERRLSVEHAAREARYAFLSDVAAETGAAAVALGHTADDQAETILLHVARGAGVHGLQGMQNTTTMRTAGGRPVTLFRPLLSAPREKTEKVCKAFGLVPREDATNLDTAYTRNRVRQQVMPLLRQVNPSVREALLRLGRAAAAETDYIGREVTGRWSAIARESPVGVELDRALLLAEHPAIRHAVLRRAYTALLGDAKGLEEAHITAMERSLGSPTGKRLSLPNGARWKVGYTAAMLTRRGAPAPPSLPPLEGTHRLACPGETAAAGWTVTARLASAEVVNEGPYVAVLDADAVGAELCVRGRRAGDRFWPLGLEPAADKRLKEFLTDTKAPRAWRAHIPLVVTPRGVAWVVGWRIAHWARLTPESKRGLRLEFKTTQGSVSSPPR
ncbi:MAG: tRNA lysidine(34) synthetase TilS [Dehalococcoidia bacterium]|nr:tRNA lysidine(34) synthetase TilS [Dehalococcoidia bacterium]